MYRVNDYLIGCMNNVDLIDRALAKGSLTLSNNEKLDYYFKIVLNYRTDFKMFAKNRIYRLAKFYQVCFKEMKDLFLLGYNNDSALKTFKRINRAGRLCLGTSSPCIYSYDKNGCLYIGMDDIEDLAYECTWKIYDIESFYDVIAKVAAYYVKNSGKYNEFATNYFSTVVDVFLSGSEVVPYTDLSESQTLEYILKEKSNTSSVIQFRRLGGVANDRNRRGVLYG